MKNLLLLLVCACALVSCSKDAEMFVEEPIGMELKSVSSAKAFYNISNSHPLYEYICTNGNGTDYYYTMEFTGTYKTIKGSNYSYVGCRTRIMREQYSGSNYYKNTPIYRYYTPSGKRHRLSIKKPEELVTYGDNHYQDYVYEGVVGYTVMFYHQLELNPAPVGFGEVYHWNKNIFRFMNIPDLNANYSYPGTEWATGYNILGNCFQNY